MYEGEKKEASPIPPVSFGTDLRSKLLEAGWKILMTADGSILESGFNPERIAMEAGVSRRSFYDHFSDKYSYVVAMFAAVSEVNRNSPVHGFMDTLPSQDLGDMFGLIESQTKRFWDDIIVDDILPVRVALLLLLSGIPGVLESAQANYFDASEKLETAFEFLFEAWDVEPRSPWTTKEVATLVGVLSDGMIIRYSYDPERFETLLSRAVVALTTAVLRPKGATIDGIDNAPDLFADEVRRRWTEQTGTDDSLSANARIEEALISLVGERPVTGLSIDAVAAKAGLRPGAVRAKGTIEDQISMFIGSLATEVNRDVSIDLRSGAHSRDEIVSRFAERLRTIVAQNRKMFLAHLELCVAHGSDNLFQDTFRPYVSAFESEIASGAFTMETEELLVNVEETVLSTLFRWPERQAGRHALDG